ncbi:PhzF family phenazine biosynthesis protein [Paenibacillus sp. UNC451MF]|uniref:PhzF family phenazine biosynthesis protein n=1 Tax=Paenibacillus sp. UNC451MF TaxID=1449063 RepID=UPI00049047A0|nr:PhzF family phenazine biosynthesis protein [Paenibacillus sp. UNC451MF]
MNRQVSFQQVDVFSEIPFKGNPVAVVLDGNELSTAEMQAIANWTNLSETTFVCTPTDPQADYRLRIFTPQSELPFAGHPTIGSAFALLKHGFKPKTPGSLVQECGSGLVSISMDADKLFLTLPEPIIQSIDHKELADIVSALGVPLTNVRASAAIDVGAKWITLQLSNSEEVQSLHPDMSRVAVLTPVGVTGVTVFGMAAPDTDSYVEVRSFAPSEGIAEDPVCGSGNGCVAVLMRQLELIEESNYVASQGYCVGRNGRIEVRYKENGKILLGGHAVTCIEGLLNL